MEGDRLIGRIDLKAVRAQGILNVTAYWPERDVVFGSGREERLLAELQRLAAFCGCRTVAFAEDWRRPRLNM